LIAASLALFGYTLETLDNRLPPAIIEAGARHLVMALRDRSELAQMRYVLKDGRKLMLANRLATICLIYVEMPNLFHARNPFAAGGVYEDPATGAAAAALGGYLRDLGWPHGGSIVITQGEDMKVPSRLHVGITPEPGQGVRVAGNVRKIT
jgi:PhzF family phenazine biosynthesis protein